jgi:hypothetical protein
MADVRLANDFPMFNLDSSIFSPFYDLEELVLPHRLKFTHNG